MSLKKQFINFLFVHHILIVDLLKILFFIFLIVFVSNLENGLPFTNLTSPSDGSNNFYLIKEEKQDEHEMMPQHRAGFVSLGCVILIFTFIVVVKYFNLK